ncbi:MAG: hypothetical protein BAJATHORv1_20190 [Candidatus Thorarchaeota archaeon]|nr:MAG: hypothetical protein BAJATHORv1_20190 [Candidatus Thorarchaeota archaeon]
MKERMTAIRTSMADVVNGTYGDDGGPRVISPQGIELRRVLLVGHVIDQFLGKENYSVLTLDDGTATVRIKAWGSEASLLESVRPGTLVIAMGKVREYEGEIYVTPEILREVQDPNYMTLHLMERHRTVLLNGGSASLDISPPSPTSTKSKPPPSDTDSLGSQILEYVRSNADSTGISNQDIVHFFEARDHEKSEIHLKLIELQEKELLVEIAVGKYVLS